MSELLTQSRPYAEAIFDIAKEEQTLDAWVSDLSIVVSAMQEEAVKILINTPDLSQRNKAEIFRQNIIKEGYESSWIIRTRIEPKIQ